MITVKKIICNGINTLSREKLADPFSNYTYKERLIKSGAIDLRDNCEIEDCGNGYIKIKM